MTPFPMAPAPVRPPKNCGRGKSQPYICGAKGRAAPADENDEEATVFSSTPARGGKGCLEKGDTDELGSHATNQTVLLLRWLQRTGAVRMALSQYRMSNVLTNGCHQSHQKLELVEVDDAILGYEGSSHDVAATVGLRRCVVSLVAVSLQRYFSYGAPTLQIEQSSSVFRSFCLQFRVLGTHPVLVTSREQLLELAFASEFLGISERLLHLLVAETATWVNGIVC